MTQTVLILGKSGRFGRNAAQAFQAAGWSVRGFDRQTGNLTDAARGVDVIVNAWNPAYTDWAAQLPGLHKAVQEAAAIHGCCVILPGNVYVFGPDAPAPWSNKTPHLARNPLGRIRIALEQSYARAGVRTIVLRAGDFIDTCASGNWFDKIMVAKLARGVFTYPGRPDIPHAWAYLPDLARAAVALAEMRATLPVFCDVCYGGYTLSGQEMCAALPVPARLTRMNWLPLRLAAPVWPMGRCLLEMRYLWDLPHTLDNSAFDALVPDMQTTPVAQALAGAVAHVVSARRTTGVSLGRAF